MGGAVEITAEDGHVLGAHAAGDASAAVGLVLCDALPGNTAHARRMADRLAAFGYRVLAPHLIDRVEPGAVLSYRAADIRTSEAVRDRLGWEGALLDIAAAGQAIGLERVGIIGFGWGATAAWHAATRLNLFRAAVGFYGSGIAEARQLAPTCPVHLMFAEGDQTIPLADVESIRRAHPDVRVSIYAGSHGFACEEREIYNPASWEAARDDALGFFKRHL